MGAGDLPDWSVAQRVTQDALITLLQKFNSGTFLTAILDVGQYSQLIVGGSCQGANGIFHVNITFYADQAGGFTLYTEDIYLYGQYQLFYHAYQVAGRYFQMSVTELTATGENLALLVVPSTGPPINVDLIPGISTASEGIVATGVALTSTLPGVVRGIVHLHAEFKIPQFVLQVETVTSAAGYTNQVLLSDVSIRMPVDLDLPILSQRVRAQLFNEYQDQQRGIVSLQLLRPLE